MIKNMKKALLGLSLYLLPMVTLAQGTTDIAGLGAVFFGIINNVLIPLIFALSFLYFLWGVFLYIFFNAEEDKAKARENMIWGVIALFIMFSVWGLVRLLVNTADFESGPPTDTEIPLVPDGR